MRLNNSYQFSGTHDPNYQTLAGIGWDVFGGGAGGVPQPKAPAPGAALVAGTHGRNYNICIILFQDPNYQTLAGIGADVFGGGAGGGGARPPAPGRPILAATADPNYQTLAGIGGDVFKEKKQEKKPVAGNFLFNFNSLKLFTFVKITKIG